MTRIIARLAIVAALSLAGCDGAARRQATETSLPPPLVAAENPGAESSASAARAPATAPEPIHPHALLLAHNEARARVGLPPLTAVGPLMLAAQQQADWIARTGTLSHSQERGSAGETLGKRVAQQRYSFSFAAENIAMGYTTVPAVMSEQTGWLGSPGHRANILSQRASNVGFGIATGQRGPVQVAVFARSR